MDEARGGGVHAGPTRQGDPAPMPVSPPHTTTSATAANRRATVAETKLHDRLILFAEAEHKLKTHLTIVLGWATLLENEWDKLTPQNRLHGVATIRQRAAAMSEQSDKFLSSLRAEALPTIQPRVVVMRRILTDVATSFDGVAERHRVLAEVQEDLLVWADPELLGQLLVHLVDNALKYSPDGGLVTLRAYPSGDSVMIDVIDEGIGIPAGFDIFAAFTRGASADATVTSSGLGLYVVANLAGSISGRVTARRNRDAGSTFTVQVPRYQGAATDSYEGVGSGSLAGRAQVASVEAGPPP